MSSQEKDPLGPPPAYGQYGQYGPPAPGQAQVQPGGIPVYTYPAEGPQQVYNTAPGGGPVTQQPAAGQVNVMVQPALQNPPPDSMVYAIFVTICCCWPIGIFAILRAMATREAINRGDRQTADQMSQSARCLSHTALGCGIGVLLLLVAIIIVYMVVIIPGLSGLGGN